ncbi:glycosyltransferase family 2 protein [Thermobacillus sp. ZCTH02-B1]|mgnify:CR=1 FL=1|uniref:glycosyltransferase family 2 protein n=1 Tax=Thermobacillus sp. ZCTH02-B1 TaxID=1858795 RepID=UPI0025DDFC52|nr:glycosyltransferase family 2 protein [Thermobacillus sp. ZCTH02-B1]
MKALALAARGRGRRNRRGKARSGRSGNAAGSAREADGISAARGHAVRRSRGRSTAVRPETHHGGGTAADAGRTGSAERRQAYEAGREAGYRDGFAAGLQGFGRLFDGTSIIIPTLNQLEYLRMCVDSIFRHTFVPYEIIVVDNGSTDGTAAYLESLRGRVRYRLLDRNHGFAGAVNRGLMMAKGRTIVLLNNDTVVTPRWLDNLLACLYSHERIGLVGPVTNYIGGEQLIEVPYRDLRDMQAFAAAYNRSDPARWRETERLTGFCLAFRRDVWERTGYFDEGFAFGNYEDDDYNIRVKLLGLKLVIAGDTFIHHFGSVSIKALGPELTAVNARNAAHYGEKWGHDPHGLVARVRNWVRARQPAGFGDDIQAAFSEADFYPRHVAVRDLKGALWWIAPGERRPVEGEPAIPAARLTAIDLRRWPIGPPIAAAEAERLWHGGVSGDGREGAVLVRMPDGTLQHVEDGVRRPIASRLAAEMWGLAEKPAVPLTEALAAAPEGLPIIAPVRTEQRL